MLHNLNMVNVNHTKQQDGYRWELNSHKESPAYCNWTGFSAIPQKRCTTDSGRVYYSYVYPAARFDSVEARDRFLAQYSAKFWAEMGSAKFEGAA